SREFRAVRHHQHGPERYRRTDCRYHSRRLPRHPTGVETGLLAIGEPAIKRHKTEEAETGSFRCRVRLGIFRGGMGILADTWGSFAGSGNLRGGLGIFRGVWESFAGPENLSSGPGSLSRGPGIFRGALGIF